MREDGAVTAVAVVERVYQLREAVVQQANDVLLRAHEPRGQGFVEDDVEDGAGHLQVLPSTAEDASPAHLHLLVVLADVLIEVGVVKAVHLVVRFVVEEPGQGPGLDTSLRCVTRHDAHNPASTTGDTSDGGART